MKRSVAIFVAACVLSFGSAHGETVWRYSNWVPATHPVVIQIIQVWGQNVEKVTEGRVKLQILPALGAPPAHLDLVRNGVADVALIGPSYTPQRFPLVRVAELPFIANTSTESSLALARVQERYFAKAKEFDGVKLAGIWTHGPAHIFTISKPVASIGDLHGLKIRTAGGISDQVAKLAGATPFFAPASQTYDVLSKGVADGILFPTESVPGFRLEKIIRHATMIDGGIYQLAHAVIISQAKWDALSPADQAAIDRLNGEAFTRLASTVWDRLNAKGIETMKAAGITFRKAPREMMDELKKRYAGLLDAWYRDAAKKGVDGPAVWRTFQETVREANVKRP